ncbi:MAG: hypothetical protein HYU66_26330, partial [Armatimonadetes bacterium]|nr:hypothetical protein [Armatimonadota bacterium]
MRHCVVGLALLANLAGASPGVVVFCERGFPFYGANQAVSPRVVAETLHSCGVRTRLADARALSGGVLVDPDTRCLVWCYGNVFPREAGEAIAAFHRRGGCIVAVGVPFTHPCTRGQAGGRAVWRDGGHEDWSGRIGTAAPAGFIKSGEARLEWAEGAPFRLTSQRAGSEPLAYGVPAGFGGYFFLRADHRPEGSRLTPVVNVRDSAGLGGSIVAAVRHGGGVDVFAGCQWLADPRDPAEVLLGCQLLMRGTLHALRQSKAMEPMAWAVAEERLERWVARHRLAARRLLPAAERGGDFVLPRCPAVRATDTVLVHAVDRDDQGARVALACLQGLVNRARPRLYLTYTEHDERWLSWYLERGYVRPVERVPTADELFARLRGAVRGAVVADARDLNVATMLASVRGGVVCTAAQAKRWKLPVIADLRGRFAAELDGYKWAFDRLWPAMRHDVLCHGHRSRSPQPLDYLVAQRIFTWFIPGAVDGADPGQDPAASLNFAEKLLAATAPHSPVLGWWGWGEPAEGIGEYWGMTLASRYAKLTLGTEFMTNMSFHSGIPAPATLRQPQLDRQPAPAPDRGNVYVAIGVLDSGNDPWYWLRPQRDVWEAPGRGQTATGWVLGPLLHDLAPGVLEWYYAHLTDRDELTCALSGLGYMNVPDYGRAYADRDAVLDDYLAWTQRYRGRLD